jgi:hypothetical protein
MSEYRPVTIELKNRIELILIEEINKADTEHLDLYAIKAANRIVEVVMDEVRYGQRLG